MNTHLSKTMIAALMFSGTMHANPGIAIKALTQIKPSMIAGIATGLGCTAIANYHNTESINKEKSLTERADHLNRAFVWGILPIASGSVIGVMGTTMVKSPKNYRFGTPIMNFGLGMTYTIGGAIMLKAASGAIHSIKDTTTDIIEKDVKPTYNHVKTSIANATK